jgi:hypothetical protein
MGRAADFHDFGFGFCGLAGKVRSVLGIRFIC